MGEEVIIMPYLWSELERHPMASVRVEKMKKRGMASCGLGVIWVALAAMVAMVWITALTQIVSALTQLCEVSHHSNSSGWNIGRSVLWRTWRGY